jgi:hypothetical protein
MSDKRYIVPVCLAIRPLDAEIETASQFCRTVKVHRFLALATSPRESVEIVMDAARSDEFERIAGMAIESPGVAAAVCSLFPEGDAQPIGDRTPFLHYGFWSDEEEPERDIVYTSGVMAGSPSMADWLLREHAVISRSMTFDSTAVLEFDSDHMYLGQSHYPEARAIFHKAYAEVATRNPIAELEALTANPKLSAEKLLSCLEPSIRAIMPDDARVDYLARHVVLTEASDRTVRDICKKDDDRVLWKAITNDWLPKFYQAYAHNVIGCGLTIVSSAEAARVRDESLLTA